MDTQLTDRRHRVRVLLICCLSLLIVGLDVTVVNIALPSVGRDLHTGISGLQWTIDAYTVVMASLLMLGGSLGDRLGRRRIFIFGTVWFAVASLLCGIAPNVELLVLARALQGVGGALLTPGSLAIISASLHPDDRARAIGAWSGLGGLSAAIGPFLGGYLIDVWSWRLVFLVNLPLALVVVLVGLRHVPESRDPAAHGRFDVLGAVLGAAALGGVTYALIRAGDDPRGADVIVSAALGLLAGAGFVLRERRARPPMLPLSIFADRQFTGANVATLVIWGALGGVQLFVVLQLQTVLGWSATAAGAALLPPSLLLILLSSRAGALAARIGPRIPMTVGPLVAAAGTLWLTGVDGAQPYVLDVLPGSVLQGLGMSLTVAPLTATVLGAAPDALAGVASGVNNAVARAAQLLVVAALPLAVGVSGRAYARPAAFAAGYPTALVVCAALFAIGGVVSFLTIRADVLAS